jgi:hypothetical protein
MLALLLLILGLLVGYFARHITDTLRDLEKRIGIVERFKQEQQPDAPLEPASRIIEPQTELEEEMAKRDAIMRRLNGDS